MILYKKRNWTNKVRAQKEAKENPDTDERYCPRCFRPIVLIEKLDDRRVYKCKRCNDTLVYTNPPKNVPNVKIKKPENSIIMIRDRSKEVKKDEAPPVVNRDLVPTDKNGNIKSIRTAMKEQKRIRLYYISPTTGKESDKLVEPYKLTFDRKGKLILYAYCLEENGIRTFKLSGIITLNIIEDLFEPKWKVEDKTIDEKQEVQSGHKPSETGDKGQV